MELCLDSMGNGADVAAAGRMTTGGGRIGLPRRTPAERRAAASRAAEAADLAVARARERTRLATQPKR